MTHSVGNKSSSRPKAGDFDKKKEEQEERERNLDETIADSFPASDPPSSIPDPDHDEGQAA